MARPRIFVSSTYFDLKHIRKNLENFIEDFGYEPILFESGDIPFHHDLPLDVSCYKEIETSHMQILVLGGRYGSPNSTLEEEELAKIDEDKMYAFYNSITKTEYEKAIEKGIPVFIFVEKGVLSEYETYKKNRDNDSIIYAHVDSINVFKLLDEILLQKTGNFVRHFDNIDDITTWLKDQWAGIFADFLSREQARIELKKLSAQINELGSVTTSLKEYSEAIMRKIRPTNYQNIIKKEEERIIQSKAEQLNNEDMITWLRRKKGLKSEATEIYEAAMKYKTITGFINNINMPDSEKKEFLLTDKDSAQRELDRYRKIYF